MPWRLCSVQVSASRPVQFQNLLTIREQVEALCCDISRMLIGPAGPSIFLKAPLPNQEVSGSRKLSSRRPTLLCLADDDHRCLDPGGVAGLSDLFIASHPQISNALPRAIANESPAVMKSPSHVKSHPRSLSAWPSTFAAAGRSTPARSSMTA